MSDVKQDQVGFLEVITGCMFAGKTTYLMDKAKEIQELAGAANVVLCVNSERDTRVEGNFLQSHDGQKLEAVKEMKLELVRVDCRRPFSDYTHVLIDEGNFYPDLVPQVLKMVREEKKHVYVAGLTGTSERRSFGTILDLLPEADSHITLYAKCAVCGDQAAFTQCTRPAAKQGGAVLIGGAESFKPVCRAHHEFEENTNNTLAAADDNITVDSQVQTNTVNKDNAVPPLKSILKSALNNPIGNVAVGGESKKVTLSLPSIGATSGSSGVASVTTTSSSARMSMNLPFPQQKPVYSPLVDDEMNISSTVAASTVTSIAPTPIRVEPASSVRASYVPVYNPNPEELHIHESSSNGNATRSDNVVADKQSIAPAANECSADEWRSTLQAEKIDTKREIDAIVPYIMSLLDNDEMPRIEQSSLLDRLQEIMLEVKACRSKWENANDMTVPWNMLCYHVSEGLLQYRNRPFAKKIQGVLTGVVLE